MQGPLTFDGARRRARRIWLCLGTLAALAAGVAGVLVVQHRAPGRATYLMLIYVGADDCAPCRAWQRDDEPLFRRSNDFAKLNYREVKSARLRELLDDRYWPEDIRAYRNLLKRSNGVPLWLIITDDATVSRHHGAAAWRRQVLPTLRKWSQRSGRNAAIRTLRLDAVSCDKTSRHG